MRFALVMLLALTGCEGEIQELSGAPGAPGLPGGPVDPGTCEEAVPDTIPLRRLSSEQYERVLAQLMPELAAAMAERSTFPETVVTGGFSTDASANTVSDFESNQIEDNAEQFANYVLQNAATTIPAITGCVSGDFSDAELDACFGSFLAPFATRAFRRPIREGEDRIARGLYEGVRAEQGSRVAFASVMQWLVQSPSLLYQTERGDGAASGGAQPLSGYEVASRLSLFLSGGLPDEELTALAAAGSLDAASVTAQAQRLTREAGFATILGEFHRDWLHAYTIERETRDHPMYSAASAQALADEVGQYTAWILDETDARYETLMTSERFPVAPALGVIYDVDADGDVQLPEGRGGILTLASVMAGFVSADFAASNPIVRGAFLRESVLCGGVLTLPNIDGLEEELIPTAGLPTARERLAFLEERSDCSGCHLQINPMGLAFENFDAIGAFRTEENDTLIDVSGTLRFGTLAEPFETPAELTQQLSQSEEAQACYATQFYRYAMGRREVEGDACSLAKVQEQFIESGGDLRALAVAIVTSRPFLNRSAVEAQP